MKFVLYAHSVVSDWNNGNAHFLRGILSDLERRGHATLVLEPEDGWSRANLIANHGTAPLERFAAPFPTCMSPPTGRASTTKRRWTAPTW